MPAARAKDESPPRRPRTAAAAKAAPAAKPATAAKPAKAAKSPPAAPPAKAAPKLDLVKVHKAAYSAGREPMLLVIQPASYLTVTGKGEPGGGEFQARLGALYRAAFTIKFAAKEDGRDFKVTPLEGQYWGKGGAFKVERPDEWTWKLMVRVPDYVGRGELKRALAAKGNDPEAGVKLERLHEGDCVQALHVGPYTTEPETIARMGEFARQRGLALTGRHHEIYLSDPRKVPPTKIRTILRYPVTRA